MNERAAARAGMAVVVSVVWGWSGWEGSWSKCHLLQNVSPDLSRKAHVKEMLALLAALPCLSVTSFAASGPAQFALFKCFLLPLKKAHLKNKQTFLFISAFGVIFLCFS